MYSFFSCLEQTEGAREADTTWALPGVIAGDLNGPRECYRPGPLRTGHANRDREGAEVCTAVRTEGCVRRSVHAVCRPTAQGSALGLCHNGGHSLQS